MTVTTGLRRPQNAVTTVCVLRGRPAVETLLLSTLGLSMVVVRQWNKNIADLGLPLRHLRTFSERALRPFPCLANNIWEIDYKPKEPKVAIQFVNHCLTAGHGRCHPWRPVPLSSPGIGGVHLLAPL